MFPEAILFFHQHRVRRWKHIGFLVTKTSCPVSICWNLDFAPYGTPLQCCVEYLSGKQTRSIGSTISVLSFNIGVKRGLSE
jgi:hypothetical protein